MEGKQYIVGLGEILFDCLPDGKKLGGAPANFAYHVSNFGLCGIAVSAIGKDEDGRTSFQPTPKVKVADTVGAGDSFTGSFVASLLKGEGVEAAHRKAADISAFVCTCKGAMPAVPQNLIKG